MRHILILLTIFTAAASFSFLPVERNSYPQDYFRSPVNHPIRLSGTFGELRSNHFHSGIDIKSVNGKTGEPIYAIADGYVSRIKVESGGYGNVLYVNHPNGYTSVYAHLESFDPAIEKYIRQYQYRRESFELDVFPEPDKFSFSKGEVIGKLGISGRSFGPHLHFEIRETKSEKPINPLLFGIEVSDKVPPKLHQLKAYHLNDKLETIDTKTYNLIKTAKGYRIKGDTMVLGAWRAGFALKAFDHMQGTGNWNGIYSLTMYENDKAVYEFVMDKFSFAESRYINAHLDYEEQVLKKSYFNRCYALPGNRLSIYNELINNGAIKLIKGKASKIKLVAEDMEGNSASLEFWVRRGEVSNPPPKSYNYFLPFNEDNLIDNGAVKLFFPKGSLYENLYLQYQSVQEKSADVYSSVHHVHDYTVPVHKYYTIDIKPNAIPEDLRPKAFIAYCEPGREVISCGGKWIGDKLQAKVRDFGDFCIMVDVIPPVITPVRFSKDMRGWTKFSFKITDNFKTARNVRYLDYRATVDGKWVLLEYDAKKNLFTHYFEGSLAKGTHDFKLIVRDDRDNESIYEQTFQR